MAAPLLDPPSAAELTPRDIVYDRDDAGRLAWTVRAPSPPHSSLPVWSLAETGDAPLGSTGAPRVVARHITPKGLLNRFATRVVVGWATGEVQRVHPRDVLEGWRAGQLLLEPASRHAISPDLVAGVEWSAGIRVLPLRTATLPPATHTNAVFVGERHALLVDPGTTHADELTRLYEAVDRFVGRHGPLAAVFLTHHHADHVSGVPAVVRRLRLPVWAHPETAARVPFAVDRPIAPPTDGSFVALEGGPPGWTVAHTPGHAAGHLVLRRAQDGAMVVGDMIASVGTIFIDPDEGDVSDYVRSLRALSELPAGVAQPAHGDLVLHGSSRFGATADHREWREAAVLGALSAAGHGWLTVEQVAHKAYAPHAQALGWLALRSTEAHLRALERAGRATRSPAGWRVAGP